MLTVIPMEERHIPALARLEQLCFSLPWTQEGLREELTNPTAVFLVAEEDGGVAGYMGFHVAVDEGFIANVAVDPEFRRRGVASCLLAHAQTYAREHGVRRLALEVRPSNEGALALYRRAGFVQDGCRPHFYTAPVEDAWLYSWLAPEETEDES